MDTGQIPIMIHYIHGKLLASSAEALVNTVNEVGDGEGDCVDVSGGVSGEFPGLEEGLPGG